MFSLSSKDLIRTFASDIAKGTPEWLIQWYAEKECVDINDVVELPGEMDVLYPKDPEDRYDTYPWLN